jgi:hypothetical protein
MKKREETLKQQKEQLESKESELAVARELIDKLNLELEVREQNILAQEADIAAREQALQLREALLAEKEAKGSQYLPPVTKPKSSPRIQDVTMQENSLMSALNSPCPPRLSQKKSLSHLVAARAISETPKLRKALTDINEYTRYACLKQVWLFPRRLRLLLYTKWTFPLFLNCDFYLKTGYPSL